jgi:hypothetical protein
MGQPRYLNAEAVQYQVTATYEDGSTVEREPSVGGTLGQVVDAGSRVPISTLLGELSTVNIESFVMEVAGYQLGSSQYPCNSANARSRFVQYDVYDESLVNLGGIEIQSINIPASQFAANINEARSPRKAFFQPPFNPDRYEYTIKLDPLERAIFVNPSVLCERSQILTINGGVRSPTALEPYGDYYFEVPGDTLIFEIVVSQRTDPEVRASYFFTIDKTVDEENFFTSTEGIALMFIALLVVAGASGSVYYANNKAKRQLKLIEEQDFDNFADDDDENNAGVVSASAYPPCAHCGTHLATPRDEFCRNCGAEQSKVAAAIPAAAAPALASSGTQMFCRECGKEHKNATDMFCHSCGTPVKTPGQ